MPTPRFFRTPSAFNRWLAKHHATARELWVGYYKKGSGRPSVTWPESVAEALCYGWIDGVRRSVDDTCYMIRFTPRRPDSTWSQVNIRRATALIAEGRMRPPGLAAFEARDRARTRRYSFENRSGTLPPEYLARLRANRRAWAFFQAQPPWYRRTCAWWVVSARREETRQRRLTTLVEDSAHGRAIAPLARPPRKR
jgi:uncharacterized protein YdeI (YjbR/CyaY-like superfamily)